MFLYRQSYCDKDVPRPPKEGRAGRDIFTQVAYATLNGSAVNTLKYPPCCKLRPRNRLNPLVLCVCVCVCVCVYGVVFVCACVCVCVVFVRVCMYACDDVLMGGRSSCRQAGVHACRIFSNVCLHVR